MSMKSPEKEEMDTLPPPPQSNTIELNDHEKGIISDLFTQMHRNSLSLPVKPTLAVKIQELLSKDRKELSIQKLAVLINKDPSVAGSILHVSNSALFSRGNKRIYKITDAIVRIGLNNTLGITSALAIRNAFKANSKIGKEVMKNQWSDSLWCAFFAHYISMALELLDRDRSFLAGLIANIGVIPIIQFIEDKKISLDQESYMKIIDHLSPTTGLLVVNFWKLGDDLLNVAEHYNDWKYNVDEINYTNLILVSRWTMINYLNYPIPEIKPVGAFKALKIDYPKEGEVIECLKPVMGKIEAFKAVFDQ